MAVGGDQCLGSMGRLLFLGLVLIHNFLTVDSLAHMSIKFLNFRHPSGDLPSGECCGAYSYFRCGHCDYMFTICLDKSEGYNRGCPLGRFESGAIKEKTNVVRFGDSVGQLTNPMVKRFDHWPGSVMLKITVFNYRRYGNHQLIDYLTRIVSFTKPGNSTSTLRLTNRRGKRLSLTLAVKVYCGDNYYGPRCDVFCLPPHFGAHYTCNEDGSRRCHKGWSGHNCNILVDNCASAPCANGATCLSGMGHFLCQCTYGFGGPTCQNDINECENNSGDLYCVSGTCVNTHGSFNCSCDAGYTGERCNLDINECASTPCRNDGICINDVGKFTCGCKPGFTGVMCETDVDECQISNEFQDELPCFNNGTCVNKPGSFECTCSPGFSGPFCQIDDDECLNSPCQNDGQCQDLPGAYLCNCFEGFTGAQCEDDVDECSNAAAYPCKHDGICRNHHGNYSCHCRFGFKGRHCEEDIDECVDFDWPPCQNNGTCVNSLGSYKCQCNPGFTDVNCGINIDECYMPGPPVCQNNGTCVDTWGGYECRCTNFWRGDNCQENVDECLSSPCLNHGRCLDLDEGFHCRCLSSWRGKLCEEDVDECANDSFGTGICDNNGTCQNTIGGFNCFCANGWSGRFCDYDVNECEILSSPCNNSGKCVNHHGSFVCECPDSWKGKTCEEDVDECVDNNVTPCANNGSCSNTHGGFHCECLDGWSGPVCNTDVDECGANVCGENGAKCTNTLGSFKCVCDEGWSGRVCSDDVDECQSKSPPCAKNASCINAVGSFSCLCLEGWTGAQCDSDIDECQTLPPTPPPPPPPPSTTETTTTTAATTTTATGASASASVSAACANGATCLNAPGYFTCLCPPGWTGSRCDDDVNECEEIPDICQTPPPPKNDTSVAQKRMRVCSNRVPGYTCRCLHGWTGVNCDVKIPMSQPAWGDPDSSDSNSSGGQGSEDEAYEEQVTIPFNLSCKVNEYVRKRIDATLRRMLTTSMYLNDPSLTVTHTEETGHDDHGYLVTVVWPVVTLHGENLTDDEVKEALSMSHWLVEYRYLCPAIIPEPEVEPHTPKPNTGSSQAGSAKESSGTPDWIPVIAILCVILVIVVIVVGFIVIRRRRRQSMMVPQNGTGNGNGNGFDNQIYSPDVEYTPCKDNVQETLNTSLSHENNDESQNVSITNPLYTAVNTPTFPTDDGGAKTNGMTDVDLHLVDEENVYVNTQQDSPILTSSQGDERNQRRVTEDGERSSELQMILETKR